MPSILYEIFDLFAMLLRLLGLAVFGVAFGWLALDLLKKADSWMLQLAVFLGLAGLVIALAVFTGMGALGAFAAGAGVAVLLWGLPKKPKEEKK
jgi:hypothetical protein